jgi:hypothetical protein
MVDPRRRPRPLIGALRQGSEFDLLGARVAKPYSRSSNGPDTINPDVLWRLTCRTELEQDMKEKTQTTSEPSWLDPRNDRKTPFTDAELDALVDDFVARMADTQAWQHLVAEVGEQQAREVVKQRLAAQDANSLINWQPDGPLH